MLPHPWDSPGKNTGVGCHFLLRKTIIEPTKKPERPGKMLGWGQASAAGRHEPNNLGVG